MLNFNPENLQSEEILPTYPELYHVSGNQDLHNKSIGDSFTLNPGPQGAEGPGVYFSESQPRFLAAEGANRTNGAPTVITIQPDSKKGWWRSKNAHVKKYNRPKTWHSLNKSIEFTIADINEMNGIRYLHCDWQFVEE